MNMIVKLQCLILILITLIQDARSIVCSGATPKQYVGVCYASCPTAAPYDYFNICYPNCPWIPPNVTYLQGTTCVSECSTGFADDSTRKCVGTCPQTPILTFKDTSNSSRKRCVQMCSTNPSQFADLTTKVCMANCPLTTWGEPDTRKCVTTCPVGTYYQIYGLARLCVSKCYPNYYANLEKVCVNALGGCPITPVMYYGDDLSNLCVQQCPYNSSTFAEESTQKCVFFCSLGTFADEITRRCINQCPRGPPVYYGSNITRQCQLKCNEGQFADNVLRQCTAVCTNNTFGDYSTRKCVVVCPTSQGTFADSLTKLCVSLCPPGYFADNATRTCVVSILCSNSYVGDPLTRRCIPKFTCPSGYFANLIDQICVRRCDIPYWGRQTTRTCELSCLWDAPNYLTYYQLSTRTCVKNCPANPRTFGLITNQTCVNLCPEGFFGSVLTYQCVRTCPDGYHSNNINRLCVSDCNTNQSIILYMFQPRQQCIDICPEDYFAQNITLTCVKVCPEQTYAFDGNNTCLPGCPEGLYADNYSQFCVQACARQTLQYADDSTNMCVSVCPVVPDYFGQDINDGNRKCVAQCTLTSKYADPLTRTCVSKCNVTAGYFGYQPDRRCYLTCPTGYGNPKTSKCVQVCPQSPLQMFGDNSTMTCVLVCANQTYGNTFNQICVLALDCPPYTFADDYTSRCVTLCSFLLKLFGDPVSKKCVTDCPFGYYADNTTRKCQPNCNSTSNYYKDPSTKSCVSLCPSFPDYYADPTSMTCVDTCSGNLYRLAYNNSMTTLRKCVPMCPSSPAYYADQQTRTCVRNCANTTYLFTNNTYRGCLKVCPPQVFRASYIVDLFADNTTWKCVAVCPLGYFALKHPTNTSIRHCVKMCEVINNVYYFSEPMTRKCVTQCPLRLYGTYGDRIDLACVSSCSREQFRDKVTFECQYECSDGYFADNTTWNCVRTCPNGTFAESINKTCVKYCPTDYYAFTRTNQCVQNCSHWRFYADNTTWRCVTQCPTDPDYYADWASRTCAIRCPNNTFAANLSVTTSVTRFCVPSNFCVGLLVADPINNRCVSRCTTDPMYFAMPNTKLCGPNCQDNLFADNTTGLCVRICPSPYFGVNSTTYFTCVQYCPPLQFKLTPDRICVTNCPSGLFADNLTMSCVPVCPDNYYGRNSDNICVLDCAPLYRDDTTKQCKDTCPENYTASNNKYLCQTQCDYGEYQHQRVCEYSCVRYGLFADNLTRKCLSSCPDDPWTYADSSNSKCVFVCEGGLFAFPLNRTCLPTCPPGYFMEYNGSICLRKCLQGHFADPSTGACAPDCLTQSHTFKQPFSKFCVQICPESLDMFGYQNNTCVTQCPIGFFAQNFTRTCMQICPNISDIFLNQSWADNLTHRCVQRCSALTYAYSDSIQNLCVIVCPDGLFASEYQQACVQICPNGTFAHNTSHTCVEICPNGEYGDTHTKICSAECLYHDNNEIQYRDNSTNLCVPVCPNNPGMFAQDTTRECVLTCTATYYGYIENRTCVQQCPDPYFIDTSSGMCVLKCPVHSLTFADSIIRKCTPTCTNYTTNVTNFTFVMYYADISTLRCVQMCPDRPQLLFGLNVSNYCVDECPPATFGDNDTRLCLDHCVFQDPKFTWQDRINNFCVTICPLNYFADNRTFSCETSCTTGFFADNSTRRCVVTCPVSPASYGYIANKTCIYFCPDGLFADQISRNCVPRCPTTPFMYYHYSPTNKCVRQCIYPYFAEVESLNCVHRCQDGFYGNLTTHKCQTCKVQCVTCLAYLKCLSCTANFFLFQYQCVTSCPSYPIMYFAYLQSNICYLRCPAPYFGQTNTGLCQLACPVLYYGNLITRVCTKCPTGCLTCDALGCYSCLDGYTYVEASLSCSQQCDAAAGAIYHFNNNCYSTCPDGSYLNLVDLVTCLACSAQCATCSLTAANCTKCAYKFFYNYQCVDACPTGFFVDNNLACIACSLFPDKCTVEPLTYKLQPFTKNFKLHAYVIFNRVVNLTIAQFQRIVQVKYNGQIVKPSNFITQYYNKTTFWITFKNSTSLNENALSIGFQPGSIVDMFGNQLTINQVASTFEAQTGITQEIASTSDQITTATSVFSWVLLGIVLLFLIKSGYPFLIALQCVQMYYMFTFIRLNPIPYIQLQFLTAIKNVHFLFLPSFFSSPTYTIAQYQSFLTNTSILYNCSPFIVIIGFSIFLYLLFSILSSKKLISNKSIRHFAKKVKKYRLKYGIFNDTIWFVYLYAVFMALLQFTQASFTNSWDTVNMVVAVFIFIFMMVYTVLMIYLGNKFKDPKIKVPTKWEFFRSQPSHFPMQIPMRYIRRLAFCGALLFHSVQAQTIIIIACCFLFLIYILCYKPSQSAVTNAINVIIQTSYIVLAGLYYAYSKLVDKNIQSQVGFSIAMISVKALVILIILGWIIYRGVVLIRQTQTWKNCYAKIKQNKDPQYLRQQQKKRDLQFDWGQFENRSQQQKTDHQNLQSSSRQFNLKSKQQKRNIFDLKQDDQSLSQDFLPSNSKSKSKFKGFDKQQQKQKKGNKQSNSSYEGSGGSEDNVKFIPNRTQKIKKPKKNNILQINNRDNSRDISELDLKSQNSKQQLNKSKNIQPANLIQIVPKYQQKPKEKQIQKQEKGKRAIWDDIEFDQNQI